ncbi:hypothetical protein VNI00_005967 [Paramarasmius palmivorus]|uniref:Uncharacterized protein n=1 Tax=Paramarasmius palmivorus TaxID=297713 RepID=A0AAW0DGX6_9AGAR
MTSQNPLQAASDSGVKQSRLGRESDTSTVNEPTSTGDHEKSTLDSSSFAPPDGDL